MKIHNKKELYKLLKDLSDKRLEQAFLLRNLIKSLQQENKPFKEQKDLIKVFVKNE